MTGARRVVALVLLACVFVMEGYDINAMALAVPRLKDTLGLDPAAFGLVFSALPFAIGVGGALLAPLGDRVGRRPLIVFSCLSVACATLATSLATTIPAFLILRFLTGFALGACLPNVSALSAELAPPRLRATIMSVVSGSNQRSTTAQCTGCIRYGPIRPSTSVNSCSNTWVHGVVPIAWLTRLRTAIGARRPLWPVCAAPASSLRSCSMGR